MNPQEQNNQAFGSTPTSNNFFDSVNSATPEQLDVKSTTRGGTQMNVVNAVNANGVVSGRKVVDYIWQRVAICAMILIAGLFIAVIVMVIIANNINVDATKQEAAKNEANSKLTDIYNAIGVDNQSDALTTLGQSEMLTGNDIKQINTLLVKKYGSVTSFDATNDAQNLIKVNGMFKVASLGMTNAAGKARAILYARLSDNVWKVAAYDETNQDNPCKNSSDEEKSALFGILSCPSVVENEEEQ